MSSEIGWSLQFATRAGPCCRGDQHIDAIMRLFLHMLKLAKLRPETESQP
jgi:hypothetical protein